MKAKVHLTAALLLESNQASIQIENTEQHQLAIRLSDLRVIGDLPLSKFRAFQLLRKCSQALDQKVSVYSDDQQWLSCHDGRISIHNYLLTLKAILH